MLYFKFSSVICKTLFFFSHHPPRFDGHFAPNVSLAPQATKPVTPKKEDVESSRTSPESSQDSNTSESDESSTTLACMYLCVECRISDKNDVFVQFFLSCKNLAGKCIPISTNKSYNGPGILVKNSYKYEAFLHQTFWAIMYLIYKIRFCKWKE